MSNVISVLKAEIVRLAAREGKVEVAKARKVAAEYRRQVAELKRLLRQRERELARLKKNQQTPAEEDPLIGTRFSSRSVRAQRRRLGLSAEEYGKLVGVSALTVYSWEQGRSRPRKAQLSALVAVRGVSKREALAKLAAAER